MIGVTPSIGLFAFAQVVSGFNSSKANNTKAERAEVALKIVTAEADKVAKEKVGSSLRYSRCSLSY